MKADSLVEPLVLEGVERIEEGQVGHVHCEAEGLQGHQGEDPALQQKQTLEAQGDDGVGDGGAHGGEGGNRRRRGGARRGAEGGVRNVLEPQGVHHSVI